MAPSRSTASLSGEMVIPSLPTRAASRRNRTTPFNATKVQHPTATTSTAANPKSMNTNMDILAIPDPPTPDEASHAKTKAAALALRKRRKSRRLSGSHHGHVHKNAPIFSNVNVSVPGIGSSSSASLASKLGPFIDVTNSHQPDKNDGENHDEQTEFPSSRCQREKMLCDAKKKSKAANDDPKMQNIRRHRNDAEDEMKLESSVRMSSTNKHSPRTNGNDDSNMDWAEGDSIDFGEDQGQGAHTRSNSDADHEFESPQAKTGTGISICFDDSDDDDVAMSPLTTGDDDQNAPFSCSKKRRRSKQRQSMAIPKQDELKEFASASASASGAAGMNFSDDSDFDEMVSPKKRAKLGRQSILLPRENDVVIGTKDAYNGRNNYVGETRSALKKRKSLVLPSDVADDQTKQKISNEMQEDKVLSSGHRKRSFSKLKTISKSKMDEIKSAIRKYCALPVDQRYKSDEALRVEQLTGYPLISSMDKVNREKIENGSISSPIKLSSVAASKKNKMSPDAVAQLSNKMKMNLFEKIRPLVQMMETQKKIDTAMIEDETQCRVERKKGKFRYISLETGKKVSSKEYERRYLSMIKEQHDARILEQKMESHKEAREKLDKNVNSTIVKVVKSNDEKKRGKDSSNVDACRSQKENVPSNEAPIINQGPKAGNRLESDDQLPSGTENADDIPSRDEIMADPELAAARQKMYDAFDRAAEEYSRTVLRIREERRMQRKRKV